MLLFVSYFSSFRPSSMRKCHVSSQVTNCSDSNAASTLLLSHVKTADFWKNWSLLLRHAYFIQSIDTTVMKFLRSSHENVGILGKTFPGKLAMKKERERLWKSFPSIILFLHSKIAYHGRERDGWILDDARILWVRVANQEWKSRSCSFL